MQKIAKQRFALALRIWYHWHMRLVQKLATKISVDPIRPIEWVIAIYTLLGGLYLFTPLYQTSIAQNGMTVLASTFSHPFMILLWGALLLVGALFVLYGLWKRKPQIRSIGWFSIILARFFQLLTTFLVAGFLPILWIYPLTITTVVVILWAYARYEVRYANA